MVLSSYASIYQLGHRAVRELIWIGEVVVEEKVDGSQISFGLVEDKLGEYNLHVKSHHREVYGDKSQNGMFAVACVELESRIDKMVPGFVYRGEYLQKPKHNCLSYNRVPDGHIIVFDIEDQTGGKSEYYLSPGKAEVEAKKLGLEFVPVLYCGNGGDFRENLQERINGLLDLESILGGQKIEGVVIKNYGQFTDDKHVAMAKYVSEKFKEVNRGNWKKENPSQGDFVSDLGRKYCTVARWNKAVMHMKERGEYTESLKDIGPLIQEVMQDVEEEEGAVIREELYQHFRRDLMREVTRGLPEWVKGELAGFEE